MLLAGRVAFKTTGILGRQVPRIHNRYKQKIEVVQTELQQVARQLAVSRIHWNPTTNLRESMNYPSKHSKQFEQIGGHLVASGENVSAMTSSITEIRAELARLFGLTAQGVASRNLQQLSIGQSQYDFKSLRPIVPAQHAWLREHNAWIPRSLRTGHP